MNDGNLVVLALLAAGLSALLALGGSAPLAVVAPLGAVSVLFYVWG